MLQDEALYKCRLLQGASSGDQQDGPLYKCRLLRSEDPAFGAKPRPECSAKFFLGRTHYVLSLFLVSLSLFLYAPAAKATVPVRP